MAEGGAKNSYTDPVSPEIQQVEKDFKELYWSNISHGKALIIVNKNFHDKKHSRLVNHDYIDKLQNLLQGANVIPTYHQDLTARQITRTVSHFETKNLKKTPQDHPILFVVLVSHGLCGKIIGVDGKEVFIKAIVDDFGGRDHLDDVPKIFIAQCCQDFWTADSFNQDNFQRKVVPVTWPNVHVEYTTLPGGKDFDLTNQGSIYFKHWLEVMVNHGHEQSLQTVFEHTRRKLDKIAVPYNQKKEKVCPLTFSSLKFGIVLKPKGGDRHSVEPPKKPEAGDRHSVEPPEDPFYSEGLPYSHPPIPEDEPPYPPSPVPDAPDEEDEGEEVVRYLPKVVGLPYHHPAISDHRQVKDALRDHREQQGSFLLRRSFKSQGKYVFSIVGSSRTIVYMRLEIRENRKGRFFLLADQRFRSLEALVEYYSGTPIPNVDKRTDLFLKYPINL